MTESYGSENHCFYTTKEVKQQASFFCFLDLFVCPCGNYVIISLSNEKEASLNRHERITGIDAFKVLAMFAVIFLHAHSFHYSFEIYGLKLFKYLALIVGGTCSIAVPYFITASGYLFGRSLEGEKDAVRLAKKMRKAAAYLRILGCFLRRFLRRAYTINSTTWIYPRVSRRNLP